MQKKVVILVVIMFLFSVGFVSAVEESEEGFIDKIVNFFSGLFGGGEEIVLLAPPTVSQYIYTFDAQIIRGQVSLSVWDSDCRPRTCWPRFTYKFLSVPNNGILEYVDYSAGGEFKVVSSGQEISGGTGSLWLHYTPNPGFFGEDPFTWQATDQDGEVSALATALIIVKEYEALNATPEEYSFEIYSGQSREPVGFSPECEGGSVFKLIKAPEQGILEYYVRPNYFALNEGDETTSTSWHYSTTTPGYAGGDSFQWRCVNDIGTEIEISNICNVNITVRQIAKTSSMSVTKNWDKWRSLISYVDHFPELDNTYTLVSAPSHGVMHYYDGDSYVDFNVGDEITSEYWYYTPDSGYAGDDSYEWKFNNGEYDSNIGVRRIYVREPQFGGRRKVLIIVNDLLYPQIEAEVLRLEQDLIGDGYTAEIKQWDDEKSSDYHDRELWDYLRSKRSGLDGAILIGRIPKGPPGIWEERDNDRIFWNLDDWNSMYGHPADIWVSRFWALSMRGGQTDTFGNESARVKRALDANHNYRTGKSRLPHATYSHGMREQPSVYSIDNILDIFPMSAGDWNNGFLLGAEYQQLNGNWHMSGTHFATKGEVYVNLVQARVISLYDGHDSGSICSGIGNHHIFSRGGGCVLSSAQNGLFGKDGSNKRGGLIDGKSWGRSMVEASSSDKASIFHGDLSLRPMMSPHNDLPFINSFSANEVGPWTVELSVDAGDGDPEGGISKIEWWCDGFDYGKIEPSGFNELAGPVRDLQDSFNCVYSEAGEYTVRVEVIDNYLARRIEELVITVLEPLEDCENGIDDDGDGCDDTMDSYCGGSEDLATMCDDGQDNDCDGMADKFDIDCSVCPDDFCGPGENFVNCLQDCTSFEDLILHMGFEGSYLDSSGSGNHGTGMGDASFVGGVLGKCVDFDGLDDKIEIDSFPSTNDFTVLAWVNPDTTSCGSKVDCEIVNQKAGIHLDFNDDKEIRFCSSYPDCVIVPKSNIDVGEWQLFTGTREGGVCKLYKNGVLLASNGCAGNPSSDILKIGVHSYSDQAFFNGLIDEVKIWGRALSEEEILTEYNSVIGGGDPWPEDVNEDRVIDLYDLVLVGKEDGCVSGCGREDVNGDGVVGEGDRVAVAGRYGESY